MEEDVDDDDDEPEESEGPWTGAIERFTPLCFAIFVFLNGRDNAGVGLVSKHRGRNHGVKELRRGTPSA